MFRASCWVFFQEQGRETATGLFFTPRGGYGSMAATGKHRVRAETVSSQQQQQSLFIIIWLTAAHSLVELTSQIRKSRTHTRSTLVWQTCSQVDKKTRNSTSYYVSLQPVSSADQAARGSRPVALSSLSIFYHTVSTSLCLPQPYIYRLTSTHLWAAVRLTWGRNADLTAKSDSGNSYKHET